MTIAGGRATNAVRSGGRSTTSYGRNSSREIDGRELVAELAEMGYEPEPRALTNLLLQLREGGMVLFEAAWSGNPESLWNIRLDVAGRRVVEAWPQESGLSAADVEALLAILDGRAEDPELSDAERKKWRAVAKLSGTRGSARPEASVGVGALVGNPPSLAPGLLCHLPQSAHGSETVRRVRGG